MQVQIFAEQVFNLQLVSSATQHTSGRLTAYAITWWVLKECEFTLVLVMAKQSREIKCAIHIGAHILFSNQNETI